MRKLGFTLLVILLLSAVSNAYPPKHKKKISELAQSETELMTNVLKCLNTKDTFGYYSLFPSFDTIWHLVIHNADKTPETEKELAQLKEHPQRLLNYDPYYNPALIDRFVYVLQKGEDSGIRWDGIVLQRFELHKQAFTRNDVGLEKVMPERFRGYIFLRDMLSSTTFCITITEIQKINGKYFGGQLMNILQATNVEDYQRRERIEADYYRQLKFAAARALRDSLVADSLRTLGLMRDTSGAIIPLDTVALKLKAAKDTVKIKGDPLVTNPTPEDESNKAKKEIVNRKYYEGKFDEEIPVQLYVRYMKDGKSGKVSYWDALYKFGDQMEFVKLEVSKSPEGKWLFEEPNASMDLDLNGKEYVGGWTNNENQTGYDALLKEAALSATLMDKLDQILDKGLWGKSNDDNKEKKPEKIKEDDDKGNDNN